MREYDVLSAGHLCLDVIPSFYDVGASSYSEIMSPGKLVDIGPARTSTGGSVSNTGIALKKLGCKVCFSARVGRDAFGKMVADLLSEHGSSEGVSFVEGCHTSYSVVLAPPNIDRVFLHHPGANDTFGAEDIDASLIRRCRHFHFGYPPLMERMFGDGGDELTRVMKLAKDCGATTSLDMALPDTASPAGRADWPAILTKVLPFVDIFLPSVEEALLCLDYNRFVEMKKKHQGEELIEHLKPEDYSEISSRLLSMGCKMTSLKAGCRGWYFRTSGNLDDMGAGKPERAESWTNRELWVPAYQCDELKSATGAGDCSIAGFLTAMLRGCSLEKSLRAASCLGWQNVQELDAISGVKNWEETERLIEAGMPEMSTSLTSKDWKQDEKTGLWSGLGDGA